MPSNTLTVKKLKEFNAVGGGNIVGTANANVLPSASWGGGKTVKAKVKKEASEPQKVDDGVFMDRHVPKNVVNKNKSMFANNKDNQKVPDVLANTKAGIMVVSENIEKMLEVLNINEGVIKEAAHSILTEKAIKMLERKLVKESRAMMELLVLKEIAANHKHLWESADTTELTQKILGPAYALIHGEGNYLPIFQTLKNYVEPIVAEVTRTMKAKQLLQKKYGQVTPNQEKVLNITLSKDVSKLVKLFLHLEKVANLINFGRTDLETARKSKTLLNPKKEVVEVMAGIEGLNANQFAYELVQLPGMTQREFARFVIETYRKGNLNKISLGVNTDTQVNPEPKNLLGRVTDYFKNKLGR
jgi:hypothetical protein